VPLTPWHNCRRHFLFCEGIIELMRSYLLLSSYLQLTLAAGVMVASAFSPLAVSRADAQSSSTYYVSPTGSDSDSGSQSSPFATIQHANSVVAPGDTVIVEDGTYTGPVITLSTNGTAGGRITYKAQNKWGAKLVGTDTGDGSAVFRQSGGYTTIQDFDITGTVANGIKQAYIGTSASYNQAVGNYIHNITIPCDSNGGGAISGGAGDNYTVLSHNDMIGNFVLNIAAPAGCTTASPNGLYAQMPYANISNNIAINAGYAIVTWHATTNITVFGNTLINNYRSITIGAGDAPGNVVNDYSLVQNNIIVNSTTTAIAESSSGTSSTGIHNRYIDNLIYGGDTAISLNNGLVATGTVNADPKFVNNNGTATGNYHLQSGSPAIGAGLALAGILTDYAGVARPQSGVTDIGALLFGGTSTTPGAPVNLTGTAR
jgi:hypothetical protein